MWARTRAWVLLLLVACAPVPAGTQCERVYAIGDLHGGYDAFVSILRETDLVDEQIRWSGGANCLVQLGDIVDRGARSREILDLLMALEQQAAGRLFVLLGNHEVMNLVGDLRYVSVAEFYAFAGEETPEQREAGYAMFTQRAVNANSPDSPQDLRARFDEQFPPGWFAHRKAFSPDGRYGAWLLERPIAVQIERSVFVHGGITLELAQLGVRAINERVAFELTDYFTCRRKLEAVGWLEPLTPYADSFGEVYRLREASNSNLLDPAANGVALQYLNHLQSQCVDRRGPLWFRGLAREHEATYWPTVLQTLDALDADRIVVAHTPTKEHRIQERFDGRVFLIDTGAGPAYGGQPSALEITAEGRVYAVYLGEREKLAEPILSEQQIAEALRQGTILEIEEIGSGISRPKRITLEYEGRQFTAAFKTIDVERLERTRFESTGVRQMFTDSYRYDRAAYLLDRQLGMYMVPVVVLRTIDGEEGAMMEWVDDAVIELERRNENLEPPDPLILKRQFEVMKIFDALILNEDRNLANQLITTRDWKLHLIDHSRSFRLTKKLPDGFEEEILTIPQGVYAAMQNLNKNSLTELFGNLMSVARVKALLARRDKIVEKLETDLKKFGPQMIFQDAQPAEP